MPDEPFLFLFAYLLQHFVHSSFQLAVVAIDEVFRCVVYCYVGIELSVLGIRAIEAHASHLRNAVHHRAVDHSLPPHGSHSTSYWSTDEFAYDRLLQEAKEYDQGDAIDLEHLYIWLRV